jgi:hypothetical protein
VVRTLQMGPFSDHDVDPTEKVKKIYLISPQHQLLQVHLYGIFTFENETVRISRKSVTKLSIFAKYG